MTEDTERAAFKESYQHLDLTEVADAWLRPMFKHSHVDALWHGWKRRAERIPSTLHAEVQQVVESISPKRADDLGAIRDKLKEVLRRHGIGDPRLKQAMDAMDWFGLNRSWLGEATAKWYSHQKGLEIFDKLKDLDDAREQLRQMYVSGA